MPSTPCLRVFADTVLIQQCQQQLDAAEPALVSLASVLSLAGNDTRLKILLLLRDQQLCVCDLADVLRMNVSAVSQHLRKLRDGNVIQARKVGQTVFYSLVPTRLPLLQPLLALLSAPVSVPIIPTV